MKAAVYAPPGVRIDEVERPVPGEDEVLIAVRAASLNPMDLHMMRIARWAALMRREPRRPGVDVAGLVEQVGANVTRFRPGDAVFGACNGAFADFVCTRESVLAAKPAALSFEQAACLPVAGLTALQGLRDHGRLRARQDLLVVGAAGGIGSFAVQIGKAMGARVTGVCSAGGVGLVKSLGADRVIDYALEDFARGSERYDLIFDLAGNRPFWASRGALAPDGIVVGAGMAAGGGTPGAWWFARWAARSAAGLALSRFGRRKLVHFVARLEAGDLTALAALAESAKVTPVIDRRYRPDDVPDAIRRLALGHQRGKAVVTMEA
jgi:NADPH:quinone reductase-like Zn-dependent oxidoreductase